MFKFLRNTFGFSFMEVLVATGMLGGVTLGVIKLTDGTQNQTIVSNQNFDFDNYAKSLRSNLADNAACTGLIREDGNGGYEMDVSGVTSELRYGASVENGGFAHILHPPTSGAIETLPMSVFITFDRGEDPSNDNASRGKAVRRILVNGRFDTTGNFVECVSYQSEAEKTAFKLSCELVGGTLVDDLTITPPYRCDLSAVTADGDFVRDVMRDVCEALNQNAAAPGTFDVNTGHCSSINLGSAPGSTVYGTNLTPTGLVLGGNQRTTYIQTCAAGFISGINPDGSVNCYTLPKCVPGMAGCNDDGTDTLVPGGQPAVEEDGECGASNNQVFAVAPTTDLCNSSGGNTGVVGTGPFTWTCLGTNGGDNSPLCSADMSVIAAGNTCEDAGYVSSGPYDSMGNCLVDGGYCFNIGNGDWCFDGNATSNCHATEANCEGEFGAGNCAFSTDASLYCGPVSVPVVDPDPDPPVGLCGGRPPHLTMTACQLSSGTACEVWDNVPLVGWRDSMEDPQGPKEICDPSEPGICNSWWCETGPEPNTEGCAAPLQRYQTDGECAGNHPTEECGEMTGGGWKMSGMPARAARCDLATDVDCNAYWCVMDNTVAAGCTINKFEKNHFSVFPERVYTDDITITNSAESASACSFSGLRMECGQGSFTLSGSAEPGETVVIPSRSMNCDDSARLIVTPTTVTCPTNATTKNTGCLEGSELNRNNWFGDVCRCTPL